MRSPTGSDRRIYGPMRTKAGGCGARFIRRTDVDITTPGARTMNRRLIARLDVKMEHLIKGVHLEGWRKVGDPKARARSYYYQGADELLYMDVVASLYGRNNLIGIVHEVASEVFIPITVGGGIRN